MEKIPDPLIKALYWLLLMAAKVLSPLFTLRIGLIPHRSIGRLAGNSEYYLRRRARGLFSSRERHILVAGNTPVNRQMLKMVARQVSVVRSDLASSLLRRMQGAAPNQPGRQGALAEDGLWLNLRHAGFMVEWETWQQIPPQLSFTADEHSRGRALLRQLGLPDGARWVCIHARDRAYTDDPGYIRRLDDPLSLDDYRDCDIQTYMAAADWLTSQGLWVIRVGHQVVGPLATSNPMIIDYASAFRRHLPDAEFADVYLQANCKFFVGCTAGISYYSHIFNVPMCFVDMAPLAECGRMDHDLFILKKYWNTRDGRFMTWAEMATRGWDWNRVWHDRQQALAAEGIVIIDNSPEEILGVVKEMEARLNRTWQAEPGDQELQDRFRAAFQPDNPMVDFPGYIGAEFSRQHKDLFA